MGSLICKELKNDELGEEVDDFNLKSNGLENSLYKKINHINKQKILVDLKKQVDIEFHEIIEEIPS